MSKVDLNAYTDDELRDWFRNGGALVHTKSVPNCEAPSVVKWFLWRLAGDVELRVNAHDAKRLVKRFGLTRDRQTGVMGSFCDTYNYPEEAQ